MKTKLLYLLLALGVGTGCKKDPEKGLTKATQIGANTFSCKVNGQVYIPNQELFAPKPISVHFYEEDHRLIMYTHTSNNILNSINFEVKDFNGVGTYILSSSSQNSALVYFDGAVPNNATAENGYITISKFDGTILSGTFEFSFTYNGQYYKVDYGRFDLNIKTITP